MNKITTLLSLLLFFVASTASAEDGHETLSATSLKWKTYVSKSDAITELSQITDGGTYILYNPGDHKKIAMIENSYEGFNNLRMGNATLNDLNANNDKSALAVFKFHKVDGKENTYTIESAWQGYYIDYVVRSGQCYLSTTPAEFIVSTTNKENKTNPGKFCIKNSANDLWFDMENKRFTGWDGKGNNCWFEIIPATVSDAEVTYHNTSYTFNNNGTPTTENAWRKEGTTYYVPLASYYYTVEAPENKTVSAENRDFTVSITKGETPFDFSHNLTVTIMNGKYLTATSDGYVNTNTASFNPSNLDEFNRKCWKIEESGLGVKLYNTAFKKYVRNKSTNNDNNGNKPVELDNEGSVFYMLKDNDKYFLCTGNKNNAGTQYLNASITVNGEANSRLGTWSEKVISNGSQLVFKDADLDTDILTKAKDLATTALTTLTSNTPEDADKYLHIDKATCETAKTNTMSANSIDELNSIYTSVYPTPATNEFYRIKNVGAAEGNAYITTDGMFVSTTGSLSDAFYNGIKVNEQSVNRYITRSTSDAAFGPQIWKFIQRGNEFSLKNANTQCNFAFFDGTLDMPVKPDYYDGSIKLIPVADGNNTHFNMVWGDKVIGTNGDTNIKPNANARTEATNIWQIEKVTSVPVSITAAGMASICYPMPLQVSKNQATAYYVSSIANGEMQLEEYPNGIIPANQGAILVGNEGTVNLNVVENSDFTATNHLKGATARRAGFTAETLYMLGMSQQQNKPLFMKSKLTTVPANKAYVDATDVTATDANLASLSFNFGTVDAISDVIANDKKAETYYDLNGRVVLYPQHGIFVTSAGKKVFIK